MTSSYECKIIEWVEKLQTKKIKLNFVFTLQRTTTVLYLLYVKQLFEE